MVTLKRNPSTIATQANQPIGTYHLADNPNLYEIQRTNNFELIVTGLSSNNTVPLQGNRTRKVGLDPQEIIRLSVVSCPIPHFTQSTIELKRGNNTLYFAGTPTFGGGQIVVNDFIGADTKSALMAWQNLSYNVQTEKVGLVQDYKKECKLIEYSPDYQVVRTWVMRGCWITGISENNYSNEQNDKHQITVTIQYDSAILAD